MMTSVSQRNHNKRQRVGKLHADERTSSRSKKAGGGFVVSIASTTMTNLVLLAFMLLLAFAPTSSLAEFTNDEVEIGDATNSILEQSESIVVDIQNERTHRTNNALSNMERIVDSRRVTIDGAVGEDVIATTTTNDSIDPRNADVATPPLSSQSIRNLYNIRTSESLSTPFNSNTGSNGNLFQVNAINCVVIRALHVNNYSNRGTSAAIFNVYKRSGPLLPGDTTDSTLWPLGDRTTGVTLLPSDQPSPLPEDAFTAIHMDAGTSVSLYVTRTDGGDIGYTNGIAVGNIAAKDNNIEILEGYGNDYFFDATTSPQVWNGIIEYDQCSNKEKYPNCNLSSLAFQYIGDGYCDGVDFNNLECGFDGGDCEDFNVKYPNCIVNNPQLMGNGKCDNQENYNTAECGFDGGDCGSSVSPSVLPSDEPSVLSSNKPNVLPTNQRSSAVKAVGATSIALVLATLSLV